MPIARADCTEECDVSKAIEVYEITPKTPVGIFLRHGDYVIASVVVALVHSFVLQSRKNQGIVQGWLCL